MQRISPSLVAALAILPFATGCALKHAHLGLGASRAPYQGRQLHSSDEFRLGLVLPQFPRWAVAYAFTHANGPRDSVAYVPQQCGSPTLGKGAPTPATCRRLPITADAEALEVQYRWRPTQRLRPLASVALGTLKTAHFNYPVLDSVQRSQFVTVGGGTEIGLARWLHVTLLGGYRQSSGGYRQAFGNPAPSGAVSSSGFIVSGLLVVRKSYSGR